MSYQVIARKYRPQTFDDVVGQRMVSETLKNAIRTNRVAHGYIFSGARGVGKTTMARILAKALNCVKGPTITPCGECPSCQEIAAGNSVDVLEIDAASNRGIDEIRQLRENARYLPARDHYKVFIIDEVHMLTTEAFNALLKTLEEPPERSLFVLATTEAHKLPATIQSRCQHFAFRLLDYSEILGRLKAICEREGVKAEEGALSLVAQAAEGSLRDALSLLDEVIAASGEHIEEERVRQLLGVVSAELLGEVMEAVHTGDARRVLEQVNRLADEGYDLFTFCGEFTRYTRNLMIAKSCGVASPLLQIPDGERASLEKLAASHTEEDLTRCFQTLLRAQNEMRYSLQPHFHLELALVKLAQAPKLVALERLLTAVQNQSARSGQIPGSGSGGTATAQPARASGATAREPAQRPAVPPWKRSAPTPDANSSALKAVVAQPLTGGSPGASAIRQEAAAPGHPGGSASYEAPQAAASAQALSEEPIVFSAESEKALASSSAAFEDARLAAIKALLFEQSKFLSSCLNPVVGWRFEDGQVHFIYPREGVWAAELLKGREHQQKLRAACEKVLGQPVKIYVTLSTDDGRPAPARPSAQERAQRDPVVEVFQKRFDCVLMDVKDLSRE
jgi:DNA polymerase-3 subunit gamma/tau